MDGLKVDWFVVLPTIFRRDTNVAFGLVKLFIGRSGRPGHSTLSATILFFLTTGSMTDSEGRASRSQRNKGLVPRCFSKQLEDSVCSYRYV